MMEFCPDLFQKITRWKSDPLLTSLLNGKNLKPAYRVDDVAVRSKLNKCLQGKDPDTVKRLEKHLLPDLMMTEPGQDILLSMGVDPMTIAVMSSYCDTAVAIFHEDQIFQVKGDNNCVEIDISIGKSVAWHDGKENVYVNLYNQPEFVSMRLAHMNDFPLKEVVSHPVLDKYDLVVEKCEGMGSMVVMELQNKSVPYFKIQKTVS